MPVHPLVSIIIVSYNNRSFIGECLQQALGQAYRPVEVIVVDQNSTDGTAEFIHERFPTVTLIQNHRNTGFADGMNQGIRASSGEYVLLLNSDLFLDPNFVSCAVQEFTVTSDDRLGMLAGIVYQHRGGEHTTEIDSLGCLLLPYHAVVSSEAMHVRKWVFGPAGSAMFLPRAMLESVKLPTGDYLDSTYFCYGEDTELALRAQVFGWRCLYSPITIGWHIGAGSANLGPRYSDKPLPLVFHALKNRYLTVISCYPLPLLLWSLPWNILTECGQIGLYCLTGRWGSLRCLFWAYGAVLAALPDVWAKRRWVQQHRRVSCSYLRSLFVRWGPLRTLRSLIQKA